jgi:hypothetical protein
MIPVVVCFSLSSWISRACIGSFQAAVDHCTTDRRNLGLVIGSARNTQPDTISTGLHISSMNSGMKDMAIMMSKILSLDLPLADVLMSTLNGAHLSEARFLEHISGGPDVAVPRGRRTVRHPDVRNARFVALSRWSAS